MTIIVGARDTDWKQNNEGWSAFYEVSDLFLLILEVSGLNVVAFNFFAQNGLGFFSFPFMISITWLENKMKQLKHFQAMFSFSREATDQRRAIVWTVCLHEKKHSHHWEILAAVRKGHFHQNPIVTSTLLISANDEIGYKEVKILKKYLGFFK